MKIAPFVIAMVIAAPGAAAAGQEQHTRPPVCVALDEAHDTFSSLDRQAALILVARQFEREGRQVVSGECGERYTLSHVRLGNTITVVLAGPSGQREGRAAGMDDLPPLYNQLVRALLTGSDVGSMSVVDRTNVTTPQADPKRIGIDSFGYAKLGYGSMLGPGGGGNPAIGFGYRAEMDTWGLDVSFLNQQLPSSGSVYGEAGGGMAGSLLKLQGLYFFSPRANASAYFGGGLSWGATSGSRGSSPTGYSSYNGSGLQGELSVGYELPRASDLRFFVQTDATLPFYRSVGQSYTFTQGRTATLVTGRHYNPSLTLSIGLGWRRHRR
jgi:hypothetical protein